jgi:hypothetical protein
VTTFLPSNPAINVVRNSECVWTVGELVSTLDMGSMDSSDFNDSVLDEDNFDDDEAAMDGQKAGVGVAEENFVDDEAVDGQKAGVDVDAITESTSQDKYNESNEQHVTGPNLRPRGTRKDCSHLSTPMPAFRS